MDEAFHWRPAGEGILSRLRRSAISREDMRSLTYMEKMRRITSAWSGTISTVPPGWER
nr:hypothetical protein [Brevundimonas diminuta]